LTFPATGLPTGSPVYTIECWFNSSSLVKQTIIWWGSNATNQSLGFGVLATGYLQCFWFSNDLLATTGNTITGTWNHIATTFDGTTRRLFLNGIIVASDTPTGHAIPTGTTAYISKTSFDTTYISGNISNLRVISGTALYTSNFTPPTGPLSAIAGTVLLTAQNSTFTDASTLSNVISVSGNVQVKEFTPFVFGSVQSLTSNTYTTNLVGGSVYFNGSSSYLTAPSNTAFAPGTGAFTLEMWIYWTGAYATTTRLVSFYTGGIIVYPNTSGNLIYGVYAGTTYITSSATIPLNSWVHVAVVRSGIISTMYFNGVSVGSSSTDTANYSQAGAWIGSDNGTYFWTGYISNLRMINGAALYSSNFIIPTAPPSVVAPITVVSTSTTTIASTSLLLLGTDTGIADQTSRNSLITYGTATVSASTFKYGAGSIYIPGTGNYVQTAGTNYWIPTTLSSFTVEAWIYMTQLPTSSSQPGMIGDMTGASGTNNWSFGPISTGALQFYWWTGSTNLATGNTIMSTGTWTHVAASINSGTIGLFVNGVNQSITGSTVLTNRSSTLNYLTIGQWVPSGADQYYGYIDDLRITQGVARYSTSSNFTPPGAASVQ
jgi:hypothetical protein